MTLQREKFRVFLHFLDSFLPEIQWHISFNREKLLYNVFFSLCFDAQIIVSVTKTCCSVFYLKKNYHKKRDWFSLLLRLDDFSKNRACRKQGCLTSNTNHDCNLNEFYTEEITAVLCSKLERREEKKVNKQTTTTLNFVCLASAENEWLCSGKGKKKAEARKSQQIIS